MTQHPPPPNQFRVETEFYDFIQRPEHRGFNEKLAAHLRHRDEGYISRMHNPHVPETKSWLYKAALRLYYVFLTNPAVGRKALAILNAVGALFGEQKPASERGLDASFYAFKAAWAAYEDGELSWEKFDAARTEHMAVVSRVGLQKDVEEMVTP